MPSDFDCLISFGKALHHFGANEEKALSPIDLNRVDGTVKRSDSDERRSHTGVKGIKTSDRC